MSFKKITVAGLCCAGLVACGDTGTDQALFGGVAGAGVAVVAQIDPIKGAVIGAAGNYIYCQSHPGKCN